GIFEEISLDRLEPRRGRRKRNVFARDRNWTREIEHHAAHLRVSFARSDGQVSCGSAEIGQSAESAQIECRHYFWRRHHSLAMHPAEKNAHRFFGAKKMIEERPVEAGRLLPAIGALAHGIFQT